MDTSWLAEDCFYVDKRQQASRLLGYFRGDRKEIPIIEDNGRPFAIADARASMRRGLRHEMSVEKLAWPVPIIRDGDDDASVLRSFATSGAWQLPAYLGRPPRKAGYLDANTFLQHAFENGPTAASAAQGLPPLWTDSTVEDAVQAFAASALPYLPVIDEHVQGIVRREAVVPYLEADAAGMGRKDVVGNRSELRDTTIDALSEEIAPVISGESDFAALKDALQEYPCWFVDHEGVQAVTAVSALQSIFAVTAGQIPGQGHFRQVRSGP